MSAILHRLYKSDVTYLWQYPVIKSDFVLSMAIGAHQNHFRFINTVWVITCLQIKYKIQHEHPLILLTQLDIHTPDTTQCRFLTRENSNETNEFLVKNFPSKYVVPTTGRPQFHQYFIQKFVPWHFTSAINF